MGRVMTSPSSTKPAIKVLLSKIALIEDALNDRGSMGLGDIASITETVPSPGGEDTYVEASTVPGPRSHPMKYTAIAWMMCDINVWSVRKNFNRERRFYKDLLPPRR
jgi:hypothetical protein